jgi:hypothetical protein
MSNNSNNSYWLNPLSWLQQLSPFANPTQGHQESAETTVNPIYVNQLKTVGNTVGNTYITSESSATNSVPTEPNIVTDIVTDTTLDIDAKIKINEDQIAENKLIINNNNKGIKFYTDLHNHLLDSERNKLNNLVTINKDLNNKNIALENEIVDLNTRRNDDLKKANKILLPDANILPDAIINLINNINNILKSSPPSSYDIVSQESINEDNLKDDTNEDTNEDTVVSSNDVFQGDNSTKDTALSSSSSSNDIVQDDEHDKQVISDIVSGNNVNEAVNLNSNDDLNLESNAEPLISDVVPDDNSNGNTGTNGQQTIQNNNSEDVAEFREITPITKNSCYSEDLAKLFNFFLDPNISHNISNKSDVIKIISDLMKEDDPGVTPIDQCVNKNKISNRSDINKELVNFINSEIPTDMREHYRCVQNRRTLILLYLWKKTQKLYTVYGKTMTKKIYAEQQENFKTIFKKLISEIYGNIQLSKFKNYLISCNISKTKPIFYILKIEQESTNITCTITLTTLSMILWILPEIDHDFTDRSAFIPFIKKLIKVKTKQNDNAHLLLTILENKIKPESATEMILELCNLYKIPFLNYSENKDKVIYDLDTKIPENKWASQLPKFLINDDKNIRNYSDVNDLSNLQFAQLKNLFIVNNHPITDYDSGSGPSHKERPNENKIDIPKGEINYRFNLKYDDIDILSFYTNKTTRPEKYVLRLYGIDKNGSNITRKISRLFYLNNITSNDVIKLQKQIPTNQRNLYMPALAMAKLSGDVQYFIASLVGAANNNDNNTIFMHSSKDYSTIFHVLGLRNCTYKIDGKLIDLNKKNIIGNLVSIRDRGTNFVPKSQRMIDIITLLFVILNYDNLFSSLNSSNGEDSEEIQVILNSVNVGQKRVSQNTSLNNSSRKESRTESHYYEQIKNYFNYIKKCIQNKFQTPNISLLINNLNTEMWNNLRDCIKDNVTNITIDNLNLNEYQEKVVNFNYDYVDYWIAEKIYDDIISPPVSTSSNGNSNSGSSNSDVAMNVENSNAGGSNKNKTIKHKRNKKNKTNRNKRNKRNKKNKTIRKKRKRKNKTIKYV